MSNNQTELIETFGILLIAIYKYDKAIKDFGDDDLINRTEQELRDKYFWSPHSSEQIDFFHLIYKLLQKDIIPFFKRMSLDECIKELLG